MVKQINLVDCDINELVAAFDDAKNALIPDLATCSAADLARAFDRARPAVRRAVLASELTLVNVVARSTK